jgi:hypothetical protein
MNLLDDFAALTQESRVNCATFQSLRHRKIFASSSLRYRCVIAALSPHNSGAITADLLQNRCKIAVVSLKKRFAVAAHYFLHRFVTLCSSCTIAAYSKSLRNYHYGSAVLSVRKSCAIVALSLQITSQSLRNSIVIAAQTLRSYCILRLMCIRHASAV